MTPSSSSNSSPGTTGHASIDVMIITFNESLNLPHCLRAVQGWTNNVFVIDSGSTDDTQQIAESFGARVFHHDWEGYARQKNWALRTLPFDGEWILIIDADEIITDGVRERLLEIARRPVNEVRENGFFINRLTYFLGRPIRHCGYYPSWNLRFFKRGQGVYEDREVHEHVVIDDPVGYVREPMIHDDRRGLEHYVAKHNRYSTLEARALFLETTGRQGATTPTANLSRDTRWRRWLKRDVLRRVPMPWLWRFLYMYVLRLGVLDGRAGLEFCKFISVYDYMVAMKFRALCRQARRAEANIDLVAPAAALAVEEGADSGDVAARATAPTANGAPAPVAPPPRPKVRRSRLRRSLRGRCTHSPDEFAVTAPAAPISVVVLTMNEKINIEDCLASCAWSDDVHVVDSGSVDGTIEMARRLGATTHYNPFKSFGEQRNWAIDNIPLKHDWVFHLDADERFTPELVETMKEVVEGEPSEAGFYVPNKLMFMDRWLRRSGGYPTYQMRLFHKRRMRFCDYGHGQREMTDGEVGTIDEPYLHYGFAKGLTDWFAKHNAYSTLEALQVLDDSGGQQLSLSDFLQGDRVRRRRAWKELSYKLPFRPLLRWFMMLFVYGGIFEGRAARTHARMLATYEHMIGLKLELLRSKPEAAVVEIAADPRNVNLGDLVEEVDEVDEAAESAGTGAGAAVARE